jgi:benzylsuccinate CoA-transferase BbsF subunit
LNKNEEWSVDNMKNQALAGVKILDFGWIMVGALTGKLLGDHGAQVIHVESAKHPDITRAERQVSISTATSLDDKPWNAQLNTSKYGITVDLRHPRAREVIDRLIRWADVINENFAPGTMNKLGLGYEYVSKIKPDIIMIGCSIYGQKGPLAREQGLDTNGSALSGRLNLTGWPDREPLMPSRIPYGDAVLPIFSGLAIIAALDYKRRTGKGQYIDASMVEVCVHQVSSALLDWEVNTRLQDRTGNRIPHAAPHGVFPCLGDERWCAIAVFKNEEWEAFCHVIGDPPWTKEPKFANLDLRKQNENELEKLVADWTKNHSAEEVMQLMQRAAVPAGVVQNAQNIIEGDPQLKERKFLVPLEHPVLGIFDHPAPPFKLLKTKAQMRTSPCLGEHNEYVCTQVLGMSDEEYIELLQAGVFI